MQKYPLLSQWGGQSTANGCTKTTGELCTKTMKVCKVMRAVSESKMNVLRVF